MDWTCVDCIMYTLCCMLCVYVNIIYIYIYLIYISYIYIHHTYIYMPSMYLVNACSQYIYMYTYEQWLVVS